MNAQLQMVTNHYSFISIEQYLNQQVYAALLLKFKLIRKEFQFPNTFLPLQASH